MKARVNTPNLMTFFAILALMLAVSPFSPAYADSDKHASLIIDANSGKVLHADSASRLRHPASLTKMMTLYMTFDALRTGRLTLNSSLTASKKAAGMPSTNLHMRPGDKITVRDAIKALVVRSANDVAVILAESIGGSEYQFAKQMTAVARRLGMKSTTFRNASGLPDRQQVTTARDLAVLALALRRHYPEYYSFFDTRDFRYKGKKYTTHNRVMSRITGADGLKTGYIRASGFNLVTSATRDERAVIGVVLGGDTARARDDEMVRLVERTFARMNLQTNRRQFVLEDDPLPRSKPQELQALAQVNPQPQQQQALPKTYQIASADTSSAAVQATPQQYANFDPQPSSNTPQFVNFSFDGSSKSQFVPPEHDEAVLSAYDAELQQASLTQGQFTPASLKVPAVSNDPKKQWGVQVGAYEESREALVAAANAASMAPKLLQSARIHVSDKQEIKGKTLYRARLADMTKNQAHQACELLSSLKTPCFVYHEKSSSI